MIIVLKDQLITRDFYHNMSSSIQFKQFRVVANSDGKIKLPVFIRIVVKLKINQCNWISPIKPNQNLILIVEGITDKEQRKGCYHCFISRLAKFCYYRCVARCDEGYFLEGYKCRACSPNCKTCIKAEQCETCPGAQLLIDVNHYGHLDHGQCIDTCPPELEPDCKCCENHLSISNYLFA